MACPTPLPWPPQGHWGRRDRPRPPRWRGWVVCGRTGQAQTRPGSGPLTQPGAESGVVWAPARPPRAPGGRGVTPQAPGAGGLRWGVRNAARRPTSASTDLGEAISPLAVAGFLGAFLLGTKNAVPACPPSEVTATLAPAAIRREATSLRIAAAARVAVTSEGGHAGTGFLVPNKKAPRNPATASGEMASPRSMLADVGRLAAFLTPHRSPPAPGALWGHAPPTWRPGGMCKPRPIRPLAGSEAQSRAWSVLDLCGHIRPTRATNVGLGGPYAPSGPVGSRGCCGACQCSPGGAEKLICPNPVGLIRKPPPRAIPIGEGLSDYAKRRRKGECP